MPNVMTVLGYKVYFWSNENGEPVHVHVAKGKTTANATKIWITSSGGVLSKNTSRISKADLAKLELAVASNAAFIVSKWAQVFGKPKFIA